MTSITIRISEEEKSKIEQLAKDNDLTLSQVVRRAIKEFLNK